MEANTTTYMVRQNRRKTKPIKLALTDYSAQTCQWYVHRFQGRILERVKDLEIKFPRKWWQCHRHAHNKYIIKLASVRIHGSHSLSNIAVLRSRRDWNIKSTNRKLDISYNILNQWINSWRISPQMPTLLFASWMKLHQKNQRHLAMQCSPTTYRHFEVTTLI